MPVTLTIKQVPERIAQRLRARAERSHRSLQGELMAILEQATTGQSAPVAAQPRPKYDTEAALRAVADGRASTEPRLTIAELWGLGRKARFTTPSESKRIVRRARDGRDRG